MVFLGYPSHFIKDAKVTQICKTISEFALEYRTSRERVQQQIEKAAAAKEKEKLRAKLAAEVGFFIQLFQNPCKIHFTIFLFVVIGNFTCR